MNDDPPVKKRACWKPYPFDADAVLLRMAIDAIDNDMMEKKNRTDENEEEEKKNVDFYETLLLPVPVPVLV